MSHALSILEYRQLRDKILERGNYRRSTNLSLKRLDDVAWPVEIDELKRKWHQYVIDYFGLKPDWDTLTVFCDVTSTQADIKKWGTYATVRLIVEGQVAE